MNKRIRKKHAKRLARQLEYIRASARIGVRTISLFHELGVAAGASINRYVYDRATRGLTAFMAIDVFVPEGSEVSVHPDKLVVNEPDGERWSVYGPVWKERDDGP